MFLRLLVLFTIVPALEIALFVRIGGFIGLPATLGVVLLTGIAGAGLARAQGLRVLLEVQTAVQEGRVPARELLEGAIVLVGGALLLTPGFMTDAFGLSCLLPFTRRLLADALGRWIRARASVTGGAHVGFSAGGRVEGAGTWTFRTGGVRPGPAARRGAEATGPRPVESVPRPKDAPRPRTIDAAFTVLEGGRSEDDEPER